MLSSSGKLFSGLRHARVRGALCLGLASARFSDGRRSGATADGGGCPRRVFFDTRPSHPPAENSPALADDAGPSCRPPTVSEILDGQPSSVRYAAPRQWSRTAPKDPAGLTRSSSRCSSCGGPDPRKHRRTTSGPRRSPSSPSKWSQKIRASFLARAAGACRVSRLFPKRSPILRRGRCR